MKLLLISVKSENAAGGIAVWTDCFLNHCEKHDIHCHLVNSEVSVQRGSNRFRRLWGECTRTLRIFRNLDKAFRADSYEIAHLNTSCGPMGLYRDYWIAKRLKRHGIPFAIHYHCDIPFWIKTERRRRWLRKMAQLTDLNLVLCENSRLFLLTLGVDAIKVPNFLRGNIVLEEPKSIRDNIEHVFFVGRISVNKGAHEIYKLAHLFPDKKFHLAGSVIAPVDNWQKPDNINLLGCVPYEDVLSALDQADLFLFPSHSEGFSMALMEAMARGVPCLAYDSVGANGDMLADGCGVTVPHGNISAMEQAIRDLESPDKRKCISEKAIEKVRSQYTTDAVLTLFKSLYENKL